MRLKEIPVAAIKVNSSDDVDLAGDEHTRTRLEQDILPAYLAGRRWYDAKGNDKPTVRIEQAIAIGGCEDAAILILSVTAPPEPPRRYQLPVRCVRGGGEPKHPLAELRAAAGAGW